MREGGGCKCAARELTWFGLSIPPSLHTPADLLELSTIYEVKLEDMRREIVSLRATVQRLEGALMIVGELE